MLRGKPVAIKTHVAEKQVTSAISEEDMETELSKALKESVVLLVIWKMNSNLTSLNSRKCL